MNPAPAGDETGAKQGNGGSLMVAGYHLIWTAYGFWLPNDPRGSTSKEVRVEPVAELGAHHFGRKTHQPSSSELRRFQEKSRDVLSHNVCPMDDDAILIVGGAIARQIADSDYVCYACAIMPDHVHILIRRHADRAEDMIANFQHASKAALIQAGRFPVNHPVWTDGAGWKTFISSPRQFRNEIGYIRKNPKKIGKPEQEWEFVQPYDGWMPE